MRKNSPRKFIHAVLDVLPLFIIPIFALNILHKETEPISIEVQEKISVDFNQYIVNESNSFIAETLTKSFNNGIGSYTTYSNQGINRISVNMQYYENHKYILKETIRLYDDVPSQNIIVSGRYSGQPNGLIVENLQPNTTYDVIKEFKANMTVLEMIRIVYLDPTSTIVTGVTFDLFNVQIFDLTQMFGVGNEPSANEFNQMLPNVYYPYTESQKMLVNKPSLTMYDNTDIGSQFIYALYKPVYDYFNFNNLFNMGAIYNWIELNLFSGTAPLPIFIIWNIIVYEFFIDLIFLLYSVFMFIIDFATSMIDSFMGKARKGV